MHCEEGAIIILTNNELISINAFDLKVTKVILNILINFLEIRSQILPLHDSRNNFQKTFSRGRLIRGSTCVCIK